MIDLRVAFNEDFRNFTKLKCSGNAVSHSTFKCIKQDISCCTSVKPPSATTSGANRSKLRGFGPLTENAVRFAFSVYKEVLHSLQAPNSRGAPPYEVPPMQQ